MRIYHNEDLKVHKYKPSFPYWPRRHSPNACMQCLYLQRGRHKDAKSPQIRPGNL